MPKRGLSAYMFFANEQRDKVRDDNPGIKFGESIRLSTVDCCADMMQARSASFSARSGRLSTRSKRRRTRPKLLLIRSATKRRKLPTLL